MTKNQDVKDFFKDMMDLDKPVLTQKYAMKLKPYAKLIYIVLVSFMALFALVSVVKLLTGQISLALVQFIMVFAGFIIVRMFSEFLTAYKK